MPVQLDENGLVPAVAQDARTKDVIMLGYMNPGALKRTMEGGDVWFYSRSRSDMWHKGEVSGNYMKYESASMDCDGDTLLLLVNPDGPICHTGNQTCFFMPFDEMPEFEKVVKGPRILEELFSVIQDRREEMPDGSYTAELLGEGVARVSKKVIEEAGEAAIAGMGGDRDEVAEEAADLLYHTLVLLAATGVRPEQVWAKLRERSG